MRGFAVLLLAAGAAGVWAQDSLVSALRAGNAAAALRFLESGADAKVSEPDGTTPLHWAVFHGNLALVQRLLKAGADPNAKNEFGSTPLTEAALAGHSAILKSLLEAGGDANTPMADGMTPLMVVARTTNVEAARLLIDHGANVNARETQREQTALMWAAAQSQPAMVKLLVERGADVNARAMVNEITAQVSSEPRALYRPSGGLTPMLYAAREGCRDCVRYMVEAGAKIDLADPDGVTPLLMAITNFHWDTARYLIEAGANVDKWDWWGRNPLYCAVDLNTIPHGGRADLPSLDQTTSLEIIELLLKRGANPNLQLKLLPPFRNVGADRGVDLMLTTGATPLLRAAKALDAPAIKLLLEYGANPNLPQVQGITPALAAAGLGSVDADTRGWYITEDTQRRSIASLELLIKHGGEINRKGGRRNQNALHAAAFWGWNEVVKILVEHGAELDAKDANGMTPIDAAMGRAGGNSRGGQRIDVHPDTAELLVKLGARAAGF
jgi:ankyrin repeat protein